MKNIKRQLVNYRNAMVMHMWNVKNKLQDTSGEGYVDTAIKILIAVVLGALLLAGLYIGWDVCCFWGRKYRRMWKRL